MNLPIPIPQNQFRKQKAGYVFEGSDYQDFIKDEDEKETIDITSCLNSEGQKRLKEWEEKHRNTKN